MSASTHKNAPRTDGDKDAARAEGEEEEEDYMSDAFLAKLAAESDRHAKKSTVVSKSKRDVELFKRQQEIEAAHRARYKPLSVLEKEAREKGLSTSIAQESNKGFQLLKKMGYVDGSSLGRGAGTGADHHGPSQAATATAMAMAGPPARPAEPLPIVLKVGRTGLGQEAQRREVSAGQHSHEEESREHERVFSEQQENFRERIRRERAARIVARDLRTARRVIEDLDLKLGCSDGEAFYEAELLEAGSDGEASSPRAAEDGRRPEARWQSAENELKEAIAYLRKSHCYCMYCGQPFSSAGELEFRCPGPMREDHDG